MKIAVAQIDASLGDIEANLESHLRIIQRARDQAADLIVFPELSLTGYGVGASAGQLALRRTDERLQRLVDASSDLDVSLGFIEMGDDFRVFNSMAYAAGGELRSVRRKTYLPTYGRFDEGRYFAAGDTVRVTELGADDSRLARAGGVEQLRIGTIICEELWHPSIAWLLAQDGAQVLIAQTAASQAAPLTPGQKPAALEIWEALAVSAAVSTGSYVVVVNRSGSENEFHYTGWSFAVDPAGRVFQRSETSDEELMVVELELDQVREARVRMPLLRDERLDLTMRELKRISRERFHR